MKIQPSRTRTAAALGSLILALAACGGRTAEESLAAARLQLAQEDPKAAIIELKNSLQQRPDSAEARLLLGRTLLDGEEFEAAAVELRKAAELGTSADEVVPPLSGALLRSGRSREVIELDNASALVWPASIAALKTNVALAYGAQDELVKARQALAAALDALPTYAPALLLRVRELASGRDFGAAVRLIDDVVQRNPADPDALLLKGDLMLALQDDAAGVADLYRKALAARPDHLGAHSALLTLTLDDNDLASARAQLEALQRVRPGHFVTQYYETRLLAQQGDLRGTTQGIQRLLAAAPGNPRVLQLAAAIAMRQDDLAQAERHLGTLIHISPDAGTARQMMARVQLRSGRPAAALETLQPLTDADSPQPQTLVMAGNASLLNGEVDKAEALFVRAAQMKPTGIDSRTAVAVARWVRGDAAGLLELQSIAATDTGSAADLALINALILQRRPDAALAAIEQLAKKLPSDPVPPFLRAQLLAQGGDAAGARAGYEEALAADAGYFVAAEGLSRLDLREGKPEQARRRFEALLQARPDDPRAMLALAALDERAGRPRAEIEAMLARAIAARPGDPMPHRALIRHHMQRQQHKAALTAAQAAAAALPNDADMLEQLAAAQLASGQTDQAIRSYTHLAALRPQSALPLVGLAEAQLAAESFAAAEESAKRAVALAPASLPVLQTAVRIDVQAKRFDAALAKARALQGRQSGAPQGWIIEGDVEGVRGDWSAAAAAYRTALQKQDASSIARRLHGALRSGADTPGAEVFAADWLKRHPDDAAFFRHLASWAILDKQLEVAAKHLEQALSIAPDDAAALNNLAWVQATRKSPSAVATAERANQVDPNQPIYLDTLAYALASEGNMKRALQVQKQAVDIASAAPGLRLNLARLYLQAGDKRAAREELAALAQLGDGFSQQAEVRKLQGRL